MSTLALPRDELVLGNPNKSFNSLLTFAFFSVIAGVVWNAVDPRQVRYGPQTMFTIAAVLVVCKLVWMILLRLVLGNTEGVKHEPTYDVASKTWTFFNFAHNQVFHPAQVVEPADLDELLRVVQEHGRAGKKVRAVGALHSWSACAVTTGTAVRMHRLNHVLNYDLKRKRVTAQAGIQLCDLYSQMNDKGLALPTLPNVDTILLGGAVANATHGTNLTVGTFSSMVVDLQMVVFLDPSNKGDLSEGKAELVTLSREDSNPHWFEAAIASFGCLGIIYSITLQAVDPYVSYVSESVRPFSEVEGQISEIASQYPAVQFTTFPTNSSVLTKVQVPMSGRLVPIDATSTATDKDLLQARFMFFANQPNVKNFICIRRLISVVALWAFSNSVFSRAFHLRRRAAVMHWMHAEIINRITAALSTTPWINLEYAVPLENASAAHRELVSMLKRYPAVSVFAMRGVGADEFGYLSPTQGRKTMFFDVPYVGNLEHTGVYEEVEKLLLSHGGRCSWSRLFKAPPSQVVAQYPKFPLFLQAKHEMDPFNVFSNAFSDAILSQATVSAN